MNDEKLRPSLIALNIYLFDILFKSSYHMNIYCRSFPSIFFSLFIITRISNERNEFGDQNTKTCRIRRLKSQQRRRANFII
jgi:hypothetical protein